MKKKINQITNEKELANKELKNNLEKEKKETNKKFS